MNGVWWQKQEGRMAIGIGRSSPINHDGFEKDDVHSQIQSCGTDSLLIVWGGFRLAITVSLSKVQGCGIYMLAVFYN
jgi:hypothetical protein